MEGVGVDCPRNAQEIPNPLSISLKGRHLDRRADQSERTNDQPEGNGGESQAEQGASVHEDPLPRNHRR